MELTDMSVVVTACRRPYYLEEILRAWSDVIGLPHVRQFAVALGHSARRATMLEVIAKHQLVFPVKIDVWEDSPEARVAPGMHRALGEAANQAFADPLTEFVVFGEEDVTVSDDVLMYMRWAGDKLAVNWRVIAACAHNQGGAGWDPHVPPRDEDAEPWKVRLLPYYNGWVWGTWRDRWEKTLRPRWDWECNSGGPMDSGYDWNIQKRILPAVDGLCAVPDAARSQTIGQHEGVYSSEESWAFSQSASFKPVRGYVHYELEPARCAECGHAGDEHADWCKTAREPGRG